MCLPRHGVALHSNAFMHLQMAEFQCFMLGVVEFDGGALSEFAGALGGFKPPALESRFRCCHRALARGRADEASKRALEVRGGTRTRTRAMVTIVAARCCHHWSEE